MISLEFGASTKVLSGTPTSASNIYITITAVTDSVVTYTEIYEDQTTGTFTSESLNAGQTLYGRFHTISAASGHAKVTR